MNEQKPQNPELPEGTWAITEEDKALIQKFGRALSGFVLEYAKTNGVDGKFHTKTIAGGFEYFMSLQKQKGQLIGDDVLMSQDTMEKYNLGADMVEPFSPAPVVEETPEVTVPTSTGPGGAEAVPGGDADVENASPAPSTVPVEDVATPVAPTAPVEEAKVAEVAPAVAEVAKA